MSKNHWSRSAHENLLRSLSYEYNKRHFKDNIDYLTDNELLILINGFLVLFGLQTYNNEELNRKLST